MNTLPKFFAAAGLALLPLGFRLLNLRHTPVQATSFQSSDSYAPVAVLELFTSQGCSSCPSADRLLTETLSDAARTNKNVIGLSFHVDYWDRLGWKDPFSQHQFTQRQYQYSEHFAQSGVYTPQEVLNGRKEFVGSNRSQLSDELKNALSAPATASVQLNASTPKDNKLTVTYQLAGNLADAVLNVAVVSKTTTTSVQRGENAGRKLTHDNVVRAFQSVQATTNGKVDFSLPADYDSHTGAIIGYVQARQTLSVRGAAQVNL